MARRLWAVVVVVLATRALAETPHQAGKDSAPEEAKPHEQPATSLESQDGIATGAHAAAIASTVWPGFIMPGTGLRAAGDSRGANRVLIIGASGFGALVAGGALLGGTGASRRVSDIAIPLGVAGMGLFMTSWFADIYGGFGGTSFGPSRLRDGTISTGYAYIYDPQFRYSHFSTFALTVPVRSATVTGSLWTAANADNQQVRLAADIPVWRKSLGTRISVAPTLTFHNYGDDGFRFLAYDVAAVLRLHWADISPRMHGAFTQISLGLGQQWTGFDAAPGEAHLLSYLVGQFGFGIYLPKGGEIMLHYDQVRNDFAGGISPGRGMGSGFLGHAGVMLRQPLNKRWRIDAGAEFGAAWVFRLAVAWRWAND